MAPRISSSTQPSGQLAPLQAQSPEQPAKASLPILAEEAVKKVHLKAVEVALEVLNAHRDIYRGLLGPFMTEMQAMIEDENRKLGAEKDQSGCIQYRRLTQNQLITLCCSILQAGLIMGSHNQYSCKFQFGNYQPTITIKDNFHNIALYYDDQTDEGELLTGEVQGASLLELQKYIKSSPDLNITIPPAKIWRYRNDYPTADPGANSLQAALYMILFHDEDGNTFMSPQQRNDIFDFAIIGTQQDQMQSLSVGFLYTLSEAIKKAKLDTITGCFYRTMVIGSNVYTITERIIDKLAASGRTTEPDFDTTTSRFEKSIKTCGLSRSSRSDCSEDSIVEHWDVYRDRIAELLAQQPIKCESKEEHSNVVRPSVIDICDSDNTIILTIPHITIEKLKTVLQTTHFPSVNIDIDAIESAAALNAEVKQPNWQVDRLYNFATYREFKEYCIYFFANTFDIQKEKDPKKFKEFAVSIASSLLPDFPVNNRVIQASLDSCQQVKPSIKILPVLNIETIKVTEDSYRACFNEYLEEPGKSKGRNNKMVLPIENNKMVLPIMCTNNRLCLLFIQYNPNKRSLTIHTLQPFTPGDPDIDDFLEVITKGNQKVTETHVFLMDNAGLDRLEQNNSAVHALLVLGSYVKMADPLPDAAYEQYKSDLRQFKPTADIDPMTMVRCFLLSQAGAYLAAMEGSTASALPLDRPASGIKHH